MHEYKDNIDRYFFLLLTEVCEYRILYMVIYFSFTSLHRAIPISSSLECVNPILYFTQSLILPKKELG